MNKKYCFGIFSIKEIKDKKLNFQVFSYIKHKYFSEYGLLFIL